MKTLQPGIYDLYKASHSVRHGARYKACNLAFWTEGYEWWFYGSQDIFCLHTSSGDPTTLMLARTLGNSSSTTSLPATSCDSTTAVKASTAATCIVLIYSQIFQQSSKATLNSSQAGHPVRWQILQHGLHTLRDSSNVGNKTQRGLPTARNAGFPLARTSAGKLQQTAW